MLPVSPQHDVDHCLLGLPEVFNRDGQAQGERVSSWLRSSALAIPAMVLKS